MYKVTSDGIVQGEELELTNEDLEEILMIFSEAKRFPSASKNNGVWSNGNDTCIDAHTHLESTNLRTSPCSYSEV